MFEQDLPGAPGAPGVPGVPGETFRVPGGKVVGLGVGVPALSARK